MSDQLHEVFRRMAVSHHASGRRQGSVVRLAPRWLLVAQGVLAVTILAIVILFAVGQVHEDLLAPAQIRPTAEGGREIVAHFDGAEATRVRPGAVARLALDGQGWKFRELVVDSVVHDTTPQGTGPTTVTVTAKLPDGAVTQLNQSGVLAVRVGSQSAIRSLWRRLGRNGGSET